MDSPALQIATVTNIVPDQHAVDVQFHEDGEIMSQVKVTGRVYWNLQIGDVVLIGFIRGMRDNPIVIDKILMTGDELLEESDPDDIHLKHVVKDKDGNVTGRIEIQTDKNGNMSLTLSGTKGNLNLNIKGEEGKVTATIAGDADISVGGDAKLNAKGKVEIEASQSVDINGTLGVNLGSNLAKQLLNNLPVCIVTGAPHALGNTNVKA